MGVMMRDLQRQRDELKLCLPMDRLPCPGPLALVMQLVLLLLLLLLVVVIVVSRTMSIGMIDS